MSKRWGRFFAAGVNGATSFQRPWRRAATRLQVGLALKQRHAVETPRGPIAFVSPHPRALEYPRDFLKREPETLAWIDAFAAPCIEDKVLQGGARTLADPALRGIMVEMTSGASKRNAGTEAALARAGFRFRRWGIDSGLGALNAEFSRG